MTTVRGTEDVISPHGIPADLIDRLLIVRTLPYNKDEIRLIIERRSAVENLALEDGALDILADMATHTSLRYALQLLSPAGILSSTAGRQKITIDDINEAKMLFIDAKRSTKILENSDRYM